MADALLQTSIQLLREENAKQSDQVIKNTATTSEGVDDLKKTMKDLLGEFRGQAGDREESRRDNSSSPTGGGSGPAPKTGSIEREQFELKGVLQIVGAIGASIAGFVVGFASAIKNGIKLMLSGVTTKFANLVKGVVSAIKENAFIKKISSTLKGIFKPITRFVDALSDVFGKRGTGQIFKGDTYKVLGRLTGQVRSFADFISRLGTTFRYIAHVVSSKTIKALDTAVNAIKAFGASINNILKSLRGLNSFGDLRAFAELKKVLSSKIVKPFQNFINGIRGVAQSTSRLGKTLGKFFGAFKVVGRFVAFPLTIIMGLIDGIKGMFAGAKRQEGFFNKLVGGFFGIFTGLVKGLIGMPLDLIKDLISWIAGKLGFENFSKALDSFSFSEIIQKIGDGIADFFIGFTDGLIYNIKNIFANIMKPFEDGFSFGGLIEFVLTIPLKLYAGFLDLIKNGVSSLLGLFGATDMQKQLEGFSFSDEMNKIIDWVKELPSKAINGLMSLIEGVDVGSMLSGLGDFSTMMAQKMKDLIRSILPDPDSLAGKLIPNALYDFVDAPVPPPAPKEVKQEKVSGKEESAVATVATEDRTTVENELAIAKKQLEQDKLDLDAAIESRDFGDGDEYAVEQAKLFTELSQAQIDELQKKLKTFETKQPEAPTTTPQKSRGQQVSDLSKEIAQQSGKSSPVVISAPSQSNVTNNTQSMAAIMSQNQPTVDQNDRTYHLPA
jgi:hypothetical protein